MVAYAYRFPQGVVGNVSRNAPNATIEPKFLSTTAKPAIGTPVKLVAGVAAAIAASDANTVVYGILTRAYPTSAGAYTSSNNFGNEVAPDLPAGILKRGYITVQNLVGTPAVGGAVYFRNANGTANNPLGSIEAAASANVVQLLGAYFNGTADADGTVEIAYNL